VWRNVLAKHSMPSSRLHGIQLSMSLNRNDDEEVDVGMMSGRRPSTTFGRPDVTRGDIATSTALVC